MSSSVALTDNKEQKTLIPSDTSLPMQTVFSEQSQQTSIVPENSETVVVANNQTSDTSTDKKMQAASSRALRINPVIALEFDKSTTSKAQQNINLVRHKRTGFKKADQPQVIAEQAPLATKEDDKEDLLSEIPAQVIDKIVASNLSPLFYENMINNVPTHIAPEVEEEPKVETIGFLSKTKPHARVPFSGNVDKNFKANRIIFETAPLPNQYVFEATVHTPQAFSGHVAKNTARPSFIEVSSEPQYVFAAQNRRYQFSGAVQKATMRNVY